VKLLMVFHAPPCPPDLGPARRHYHELDQFLSRGHSVSVLSYGTAADEARFTECFGRRVAGARFVRLHRWPAEKACRRVWHLACGRSDLARLRTAAMQRALDETVAADHYDVAWFSTTMLGALRLPQHLPLVGDTHNVEFDNLRRAFEQTPPGLLREYFRIQSALTRREETAYARKFDIVCATSERDRAILRAAAPGVRIELAPNGVDLDAHPPRSGAGTRGTLVFTGLMSYYPNAHGVRWFVDEILPRIRKEVPSARVLIVGAQPPKDIAGMHPGVVATGYVPDVRPYLTRAQAFIVPLKIGGGTRVKALQAMAMGVPVVSTSLGIEGLGIRDREHALVADDADAFARAAVTLLQTPAVGWRLAQRAAAHVRQFDRTRIGEELERVAASAVEAAQTPVTVPDWPYVAHQA
jgi:glycosyltransferase involved in cell wall biosynthesis